MYTSKTFSRVVFEGLVLGFLLIPSTYLTGMLFAPILRKPMLPDVCRNWNQFYVMEINLVLAGLFFYILFEYSGWHQRSQEPFQTSAGLRESCEDTVCSHCMSYAKSSDYPNFKKCKQQCFIDKKKEIEDCCRQSCPDNNAGCLESCSQALMYG